MDADRTLVLTGLGVTALASVAWLSMLALKRLVHRHSRLGPTLLALGASLRLALFHSGWCLWLAEQNELSTPVSSINAVSQGAFLLSVGRPSHSAILRPTLVLQAFQPLVLPLKDSILLLGVAFTIADIVTALAVFLSVDCMVHDEGEECTSIEEKMVQTTRIEAGQNERGKLDFLNSLPMKSTQKTSACMDPENAATFALAVFMFNPFTVLSCAAMTLNVFTIMLAFLTLTAASSGSSFFAGVFLAFLLYMDAWYAFLTIPLFLQFLREGAARGAGNMLRCLLVGIGGFVLLLTFSEAEKRAETLDDYVALLRKWYVSQLDVADLTPNIGLWWYFVIEVFQQSREFFLFVFRVSPLIYLIPLCISLRQSPEFLGHTLLVVYQLYTPYPEFSGIGVVFTVVFMHRHSVKRLGNFIPLTTVIVATSCLLPVMRFMWLTVGSGNANYYYFQTLALQFSLSNLVASFVRTRTVRDKQLRVFRKQQTKLKTN